MKPPLILPVSEFQPDLPDYPAQGSATIRNVYPRTSVSYGSVGQQREFSLNALDAPCQGAAGFVHHTSGEVHLFAGTATKLYRITKADNYVWQDVSRPATPYAADPAALWEFEMFNHSIIATNGTDALQVFNLDTDSQFSDLPGSPPQAKHMAVAKNSFLMLGNTTDPIDGNAAQRVWWSTAGDPSSWPTPGSVAAAQAQSGWFDLLGSDGAVQAIRTGLSSADGAVFLEFGIRRIVYSGPPAVFEFLPAQGVRGTPAPYSPIVLGGICYYWGYDGFYAFDGANSSPIGVDKVDKFFLSDLHIPYVSAVIGAVDYVNKVIFWCYPGVPESQGVPNRLIGYSWPLSRWCVVEMPASCEVVCKMFGISYTLDELYTLMGWTSDTLPASPSSQIWQDGTLQFGHFTANHKLAYLSGPAMAATIETSEMQPIPGRRLFLNGARPLTDEPDPDFWTEQDLAPDYLPMTAIGHRERIADLVTYTAAAKINGLGISPVRTSGRYLRASVRMPAGGLWTNMSGIELDAAPAGKR